MHYSNGNEYCKAQNFVNQLLNEGSKVNCDETNEHFFNNDELPPFYDEKLYRKGQEFFQKHFLAMFFAKLSGLLSVLAVPAILKILIFTKMSGSDVSAYRRYMATVFHMVVWYEKDFKPGSKLWKSIAEVRNLHNKTSKRSCAKGMQRISQKDMALTQFGFMGFALARSESVGIHRATDEEWKAFLHLWRVVGHLLGIEDRFNICTGSVAETRQICNVMIEQVFRPEIEKRREDFLSMSGYLIRGLSTFVPSLEFNGMMNTLYDLVRHVSTNKDNERISPYFQMTFIQKMLFQLHHVIASELLKYDICRVILNCVHHFSYWLMEVFPFLAYYKFGKINSHVSIGI